MTDQRLITLIIVGAAGWLLFKLAPILTPFVAAGLLAYLGDPLVDRLEKLKLKRTPAVMVAFCLIFFFLGALFLLILPMVRDQGSALASKLPGYVRWIESHWLPTVTDWLGVEMDDEQFGLAAVLAEYGDKIAGLLTGALGTVSRSGTAVLQTIFNVVLIPVLSFYLLRDFDVMVAKTGKLVPRKKRPLVYQLASESDAALSNFLKGQTVVMLGLALIWSLGLTIVGLEHAVAIGVLSGVLSFVPYLGPAVGLFLGGISALVQAPDLWMLVGVGIVFVISQGIENYFLTPKFVGDRIGLHPVMVIFSVMAGGQLFGFFGVLLALPVAAVVTVLVRHFYEWFGEGEDEDEDASDQDTAHGEVGEAVIMASAGGASETKNAIDSEQANANTADAVSKSTDGRRPAADNPSSAAVQGDGEDDETRNG